jgi:hypothetical protein
MAERIFVGTLATCIAVAMVMGTVKLGMVLFS